MIVILEESQIAYLLLLQKLLLGWLIAPGCSICLRMLLGDAFEQRGDADAAADDLQEALACSSLLAPLMPALARLMEAATGAYQSRRPHGMHTLRRGH